MSDLEKKLAGLSPEKRKLFEKKLKQMAAEKSARLLDATRRGTIPRREGEGPWPASIDQTALWFFYQLDKEAVPYNNATGKILRGPLDVSVLERAYNEIIARHEILRTTFKVIDGQLYQIIAPELKMTIPVHDMRFLPEEERMPAAMKILPQMVREPFDMETGPLLRLPLLRMKDEEYIYAFIMHHAITDWWSFKLFAQELMTLYAYFMQGKPSPLKEPEIQFADYTVYRNKWLNSPEFDKQLTYWLKALEGAPMLLDIPKDKVRPPVPTYGGVRVWTHRDTHKVLYGTRELTRIHNASSLMISMTAVFCFLSRYCGVKDVLLSTPMTDRDNPELENLFGYMLNVMVMRCQLFDREDGTAPSFNDLVRQVKTMVLNAQKNRDLPFRTLVENMDIDREISHMPVYQIDYNHISLDGPVFQDHRSLDALNLPGYEIVELDYDRGVATVDLQFTLMEGPDELVFWLEYATDLFERPTADHMEELFFALFEQLLDFPDRPFTQLDWISASEKSQLMTGWQGARADYSCDRTLHGNFAAMAQQYPQAVAVIEGTENITYAALDDLSGRIATRLVGLGVKPGDPVGLHLNSGIHWAAAILGILKAGAMYVPLASDFPSDRMAFVMQETGMKILLSLEAYAANLAFAADCGVSCHLLDRAEEGWLELAPLNPPVAVASIMPAYVIYTSGTTGTPKGVVVDHRGSNRLIFDNRHVPFSAGDVFSQISKISFDAHIMELWTPLSHGGALSIVSRETLLNADLLAEQVQRDKVGFMFMTPTLAARFVHDRPEIFDNLRVLVLGGEAAEAETVRIITARGRGIHVLNTYGPTETTVYMTIHDMSAPDEVRDNVPIGRPVCFSTLHLIDRDFQLAPWGVIGEIYIGGEGLAMGYLKRPAATAAVFVPNPFAGRDGSEPGSRLYRSGDLGKRLRDGSVQFEGRIDHQVKLRGLRIELGEIESVLLTHPAIAEAVAVMCEGRSGKYIAAYLRLNDPSGTSPSTDELRDHLMQKTPEYMVPAIFITLDRFPMTANGKLDRKALPDPDFSEKGQDYAAPRNRVEQTFAEIWARRLGLERVGIHDNFFRLGGDSILAIRVVAEAAEAGLKLSTMQLFQNQTIAQLASCLKQDQVILAEQGLIEGEAPLSPIQHWFFEQYTRAPHHFNMALCLRARQTLTPDLVEKAWQAVASHHDVLRLRFPRTAGSRIQYFVPDLPQLEVVALADAAAITDLARDWQQSLNPESGPIVRALFCRLESGEGDRFVLIAHHLICDTISLRTILEDLERACLMLSAGRSVMLPPKTTSWKQWCQRLEDYSRSEEVMAQLTFWQTSGRVAAARLAYDFPNPPVGAHAGSELRISLDPDQTRALLQDTPGLYNTRINDLLLVALTQTFGQVTGNWSTRIALEGHGREALFEDLDITRTAGWFSTTYPVLLSLDPKMTSATRIKTIKEQLRMVPQNGIGYGLLRQLNPETAPLLAATESAQLMFNYLGRYDDLEGSELFSLASDDLGPGRSAAEAEAYDLELTGIVLDGKLQFIWKYSDLQFQEQTIASLAQAMMAALSELVQHCLEPGAGGRTPSDFPLLRTNQSEIDGWIAHFGMLEEVLPVTPMQEGLLFHSLHQPENEPYVEAKSYRFLTRIQPEKMQAALQNIVDRHAVLRSVYQRRGQKTAMLVQASHRLDFKVLDRADSGFESLCSEVFGAPLDPFSRPPLQARLVRHEDLNWRLMLRFHHVILDGWSIAIIMEEALSGYAALCEGRQPVFQEPRPYRDYVAWLYQQDQARALAFWRDYLAGFEQANPLSTVAENGEMGHHRLRRYGLDKNHFLPIQTMAREQGVTVNTLIQAAWSIALGRLSGSDDVVFGMTGSGRPPELDGMERMVGLFISTLPIRLRPKGRQSVSSFLKEVQILAAEVRQYEYSPLVEIKKVSSLSSESQLFQSMIVFENYPAEELLKRVDKPLKCVEVNESGATDMPLILVCGGEDELFVYLDYDSRMFSETRIDGFWQALKNLLEAMAINPEVQVRNLPMLSGPQKKELLTQWQNEGIITDLSIPELFAHKVAQGPQAPAIRCLEQELSYSQLAARAAAFAELLLARGLLPGDRVAIQMDQTRPGVFTAILGVLMAGGAYLPLDPDLPSTRRNHLIEDSQVQILLSDTADHGLEVNQTLVPGRDLVPDAEGDPKRTPRVVQEQLAYVMYTSGTTGKPKGVMISHRNVVQLVAQADFVDLSPERVVLHSALMSFDASTFELWGTLLNGACLVPANAKDVIGMLRLIETTRVDTLHLTTQVFNIFADLYTSHLAGVRQLLTGGETLSLDHKNKLLAALPGVRLIHCYGPTENTTFSTCTDLALGPDSPIGKPVRGGSIYILDHNLALLPQEARGQLYLGGEGLASGYQNKPGLTALQFIPSPFSSGSGGDRLYATGDLVSWSGGQLYFHGRGDRQVKLRGFRIELAEVELALRSCDLVDDAVVQVRGDQTGQRLLAWVRGAGLEKSSAKSIRASLGGKLPPYMIPSAVIVLDAFPLKGSGKVDTAALPEPGATTAVEAYVAPRNETEQILADIWSRRLGAERVGVYDNFFRLGGDSILAIRIVAEAMEAGLHLKTMQIFEKQTIAGLASSLLEFQELDAEQGLVEGEAQLSPVQHWFFNHYQIQPDHFNMAVQVKATRSLNVQILGQALDLVVEHHDSLRLRYPLENGRRRQLYLSESRIPLELVDLSLEKDPVAALEKLAGQRQAGFDIAEGPLATALYCNLGEQAGERFVFLAHHLVCDTISLRLILEDLERAYTALEAGQTPALPRKTSSWKAWTHRLVQYSQTRAITDQLEWWLERDRVEAARLACDFPGQQVSVEGQEVIRTTLAKQATHGLLHEVPPVYNTRINEVLLTALTLAIGRVTGSWSARVAVETHGRQEVFDDLDLNRTVGWFTLVNPILIRLHEAMPLGTALKSAKEQMREIPGEGLGYGLLRYLNPETRSQFGIGQSPWINFNYLGQYGDHNDSELFQLAHDPLGPTHSGLDPDVYDLDINTVVLEERLELVWRFNCQKHRRETIQSLADAMMAALSELITHCQTAEQESRTPSDYPMVHLKQEEIDGWFERFGSLEDILPVTPMQEGMLFHSLVSPETLPYTEIRSFRFKDDVDPERLRANLQAVINRHGLLRSLYQRRGGAMALLMKARHELDFALLDLEDTHFEIMAGQVFPEPLDPFNQVPLQARLIRHQAGDWRLLLRFHHVMLDGWSLSIIMEEMIRGYAAAGSGQQLTLDEPKPYNHYIRWLNNQSRERAMAFWLEELVGFGEPNQLVTQTPGEKNLQGMLRFELDSTLYEALRKRTRELGITVNTVIQGAWALLLGRLTGRDDVLFGMTGAGRPPEVEGIERMVGMFINTLPLRLKPEVGETSSEFLTRVQMKAARVRQFEFSSLAEIQRAVGLAPGAELFQSLVVFENFPTEEVMKRRDQGLECHEIEGNSKTNVPLVLASWGEDHLAIQFDFDTARFSKERVAGLQDRLCALIEGLTGASDRPVLELPMTSATERARLLAQWQNEHEAFTEQACIHERFLAQVKLRADAPAVITLDQQLTYAELARQARAVAGVLLQHGLQLEERVAILADQSDPSLFAAVIGILLAGGLYVPLDNSQPVPRLNGMLADSAISLLITDLPQHGLAVARTLLLEDLKNAGPVEEVSTSGRAVDPLQGAYVMYTSGTTGEPKGVVVPHRGVIRLVVGADYVDLGPETRMLHSSILTFDQSTFQIWGALLNGGCLVPGNPRDPVSLFELTSRVGVNTMLISARVFNIMTDHYLDRLKGLKQVLTGGEEMSPDHKNRFLEALPEVRLINSYGPTETTVTSSAMTMVAGPHAPIGPAILGASVYVLDHRLGLLPEGAMGRLYLGGVGLTRGYQNKPGLSAEKFVPSPFPVTDLGGERLYDTGDLALWLDGSLHFRGRRDRQVKLRGFRIELLEVEVAIRCLEGIRDVVVQVRGEGFNQRLVAWVSGLDPAADTAAMEAGLREKLPDYMVPRIIVLENLPLKANGKIDGAALVEEKSAQMAFVPPENEIQQAIVEAWTQVLGIEKLSIHENFFEAGAHSLTTIRFIARLHETLGIELETRTPFEAPTAALLARHIEALQLTNSDFDSGEGEEFEF